MSNVRFYSWCRRREISWHDADADVPEKSDRSVCRTTTGEAMRRASWRVSRGTWMFDSTAVENLCSPPPLALETSRSQSKSQRRESMSKSENYCFSASAAFQDRRQWFDLAETEVSPIIEQQSNRDSAAWRALTDELQEIEHDQHSEIIPHVRMKLLNNDRQTIFRMLERGCSH